MWPRESVSAWSIRPCKVSDDFRGRRLRSVELEYEAAKIHFLVGPRNGLTLVIPVSNNVFVSIGQSEDQCTANALPDEFNVTVGLGFKVSVNR